VPTYLKGYPKLKARGEVKIFSAAARMRLRRLLASIAWERSGKVLWATVTYPDGCVEEADHKQRNIHRAVFMRSLENYLGCQIPAIWRQEWVIRKSGEYAGKPVPHYHFLIAGIKFIPHEVFNAAWRAAINRREEYVRTSIEGADSCGGIQMYLSKYLSKDACPCSLVIVAYHNKIGRSYGILRREKFEYHDPHTEQFSGSEALRHVSRVAQKYLPERTAYDGGSMTIFFNSMDEVNEFVIEEGLTGDGDLGQSWV
jgi:hypothetical protein